jgi:hypothetical protein
MLLWTSWYASAEVRTLRSGNWSDPGLWSTGSVPGQGDEVMVDSGHVVIYDVLSSEEIRMIHVRGTLQFSREVDTQLDVGMIIISTEEMVDPDASGR